MAYKTIVIGGNGQWPVTEEAAQALYNIVISAAKAEAQRIKDERAKEQEKSMEPCGLDSVPVLKKTSRQTKRKPGR
ncbi:MAG: hypothetical protein BWY31_01796 [Lentisphaerae bacterium ADurb.Bin242]|nr:MAG: hypothetical protein BWY31_01796 [Lentisphaerae bacterium ADurb.Bin242]